jgi:hypothetical protein
MLLYMATVSRKQEQSLRGEGGEKGDTNWDKLFI